MLDRDPPSIRRHEVSASGDADIRFGRFRVLPRARQLLVDGQSVELGSRAFDLLMGADQGTWHPCHKKSDREPSLA